MRYFALMAAGALVFAATAVNAAPLSPAGTTAGNDASYVVDQSAQKKKMKRMARRAMGWQFDAYCIVGKRSCSEGGANQFEARNKCIIRFPTCVIVDQQ